MKPIPPEPSPSVLLAIASEAAKNAQSKASLARRLAEESQIASATALLVTGLEELGKAHYAFFLALQVVPWTSDSMEMLSRNHARKQLFAVILPPPSLVAPVRESPAYGRFDAVDDPIPLDHAFDLMRTIVFERLDALKADEPAWADLNTEIESQGKAIKDESRLELLRQRALYVDYNAKTRMISSPTSVTREDFNELDRLMTNAWSVFGEALFEPMPDEVIVTLRAVMQRAHDALNPPPPA